MSNYNYNYGSDYNHGQPNQQSSNQQAPQPETTSTSNYSAPSYQGYSTQRSNGPATGPSQPSAAYSQDLARYQYSQNGSAASSSNARYGNTSGSSVNSTYSTSAQGVSYGSYNQNQSQNYNSTGHNNYGQEQARPDSVSSAGSVAPPPQRAGSVQSHQHFKNQHQRASQDIRNMARSPLHVQAHQNVATQSNRAVPQTRSPTVSYQQTQERTAPRVQSGYQQSQQAIPSTVPTAPVTVDPSQVYDRSAEIQREVGKAEASRKAEEERRRVEEERRKVEEERRIAEEEAKKREQTENAKKLTEARKLSKKGAENPEAPKKKRIRKSNAEKNTNGDAAANAAAMTLLQTANSATGSAAGGELEAQMKAMFAKMREFNSQNPELLSKMWQAERESYLAGETQQSPASNGAAGSADSPVNGKSKKKRAPNKKTAAQAEPQAESQVSLPTSGSPAQAGQPQLSSVSQAPKATPAKQAEKSTPKTVWPEKRKTQLAQAASSLIQKMPENHGRTMDPSDIAKMLDGNPSYLELCQQIEAKGFHLNKSQFAKALLTAVPEVNRQKASGVVSTPSQPATFTPVNGGIGAGSAQAQQQSNALGEAENRLMNGESIIGKSSSGGRPRKSGDTPSKKKSAAPVAEVDDGFVVAHDDAPDAQYEGLDAVRQFNERPVDSTSKVFSPTTDSNKNKKKHRPSITPARALPQTKEDLARKRTFADLVDLTAFSDEEGAPPAKRLHSDDVVPPSTTSSHPPQQLPTPPQTTSGPFVRPVPAPQAPMVPAMGAQQPQGLHPPFARPGHLQNYPQPTFHPPPLPQPSQAKAGTFVPRDHPINNIPVGEKIAKSKVLRRSKYNPKTIARDVLLASGRHPDMRNLNAHLDVLRNLKIKEDIDLSTIRWDIIDPGGALPGAGISTDPFPEDEIDDTLADDESSDNDSVLGGRATQSIPLGGGGAATAAVEAPHHASNPSLRIKQYKYRKSDPGIRQVTTPNKPPSTAAPASAGAASGYSALRATGDQPKKKGRPVGWRKWMQKDKGEGAPSPSSSAQPSGGRPRGRPPGSGTKPPPKPPSPEFPAFKCEWEGCTAELHNLETLRRHLFKIHPEKRTGIEWTCRWKSCGKATSVKEGPRTVSKFLRRRFEDADEWKTHIEDEHLLQIKWKQGDGPSAGLTEGDGEVSDAVLSDREGRQVTPRISMPGSPAEAFKRAEEERSEGAQGPAPDGGSGRRRQTPLDEARAELYSAEEKRRRLGVGIDKGGSTMVTDKRRRGFIEDGDVEMVDDDA